MSEIKLHQDKETLEYLYKEKGYTQVDIAKRSGCHPTTVKYWIDKHGIERRTHKKYWPPSLVMDGYGRERFESRVGDDRYLVLHHRLIAVAEHGFDAVCDKVVHHKNRIPWDNRPENLEVMDQDKHMKVHWENGDFERKLTSDEQA